MNINKPTIVITIIISIIILSQIACQIEVIESNSPTITQTITNSIPTITIESTIVENISEYETAIVSNCEYLNLRIEGNENSQIISTIPANESVTIIAKSKSNWYYIGWNKMNGWVNGEYLNFETGQQ